MKVLIDIHALKGNKTGKAFYAHNLLSELGLLPKARKHAFCLFSPTKFNLDFKIPSNFSWKISSSRKTKFYFDLLRELSGEKHDIFWSPTSFIPLAFGKGKTVGIIYDLAVFRKGTFRKDKKAAIIEKLLIKRVIKNTAALVVISRSIHHELVEKFPEAKRKTFIILGSPKKYPVRNPPEEVLQKFNLANQEYLLFVGTLEPRKNIPNTLRAYRLCLDRLRSKNKQPPRFVLVGKKGWSFKDIAQAIKKLNLERWVKLLGYIPNQDLPALYQKAKFFVYAPYYEGFGLPVIEAVSFKKACLASNTSSLPEVVGQCGMKVDPNNIEKLSEAMYRLLTNAQLRKKYEQKTRTWIKHFSSKKSAEGLLDVFEFANSRRNF